MIMRSIYLAVAIVLTGAGCSIFKAEEENDLDAAMALWEDEGFVKYSMRYGYSGFPGALEATVHVEAGIVVAIEDVNAGDGTLSDSVLVAWNITVSNFESVEGLFGIIADGIKNGADFLEVTYDDSLGYPESIQIDTCSDCKDSGISYHVNDVVESQ